jgi:chloramphenicol O-acetyltransferase type A
MKKISFTNPHRKKHFDFFRKMDQPHFNITAPLVVGPWKGWVKDKGLPFTTTMVYTMAKVANQIPEFRYRIRGEEVVEHEAVHPSFTVRTNASDVFSFCYVPFAGHLPAFLEEAGRQIAHMKDQPRFEDDPDRDDYLFLSAFPWVSFTSMQHAMHYSPTDSVPRISWGKAFESEGKLQIPVAVQAHHAVVDGIHMGRFFELLTDFFQNPEKIDR